ncbi:MAG: acyclic terpene utilization AtuA family protein [Oligoflexales bacterium]
MKEIVRIGNASGYWGDDPEALERQVNGGKLDYISMDFLAEITMSIMQKQRMRDPNAGYAKDFIPMLAKVLPKIVEQNTCIITNAGGINPLACAQEICNLAESKGIKLKVAVVHGDDILTRIPDLLARGADFKNMETGEKFDPVKDKIEAANIYFGAAPVVDALKTKPNIVITGRVTDTAITLAPMIHEFGWKLTDWDKLASGIVAGHILECGAQSTGGNFTDWQKVRSFTNMGYPIVEVNADSTFTVTKHPGTGGLVSVDTVREQLFYEMGAPEAYITPDVVADFSTIKLESAGPDKVKVFGVKGYEPTSTYKISMAYADGHKATGSLIISGPDARAKAQAFSRIFWSRLDGVFKPEDMETEYVGWNACHRSLVHSEEGNEILLRLGARSDDVGKLRSFGKLVPSLILAGPSGVAVTGGVPKPQEIVSYWPALMSKSMVFPEISLFENKKIVETNLVKTTIAGNFSKPQTSPQVAEAPTTTIDKVLQQQQGLRTSLVSICLGRSGDKGNTANIGIMARSKEAYEFLDEALTAQVVKNMFQELCKGRVIRHSLPGLLGFNFLLEEALGGGGTRTLRIDSQGKTFAQALISQRFAIPESVLKTVS